MAERTCWAKVPTNAAVGEITCGLPLNEGYCRMGHAAHDHPPDAEHEEALRRFEAMFPDIEEDEHPFLLELDASGTLSQRGIPDHIGGPVLAMLAFIIPNPYEARLAAELKALREKLDGATKAAQWQRPNFAALASDAHDMGDGARLPSDLVGIEAFCRRLYAMGLREAAGGAYGIATHLDDAHSQENLRLYAAACEEAAEELDPRRSPDGLGF